MDFLSGFLDPVIVAKFFIETGTPTEKLLAMFGAENVPQEYGGANPAVVPTPEKVSS